MNKIQTRDVWLFVAQVLLLSLVLLSPGLISYVTSHNPQLGWESLTVSAFWLAPAIVVYLLNFCLTLAKKTAPSETMKGERLVVWTNKPHIR